jgi:glycosyltransferase involved in cell wall biosynthesis
MLSRLAKSVTMNDGHSRASAHFSASEHLNRLSVLQVTPRYFPYAGGVESHVYQVSRRLARAGVEVTVLTTDPSGKLLASEEADAVHIRRVLAWPAHGDYYFAPDIYRIIRRGDWDIVHVQSYHTLVPPLAMLAAWQAHLPYVLTFHGGGHSSSWRNAARGTQRALLRPLLAHAERLIAVAEFEVELYSRELHLPEGRFLLIPNGADLPTLPPDPVKTTLDKPLIASVGRLERYKGHHRILAAFPHILKQTPEARLWIAGSGPYETDLRRLAVKLGVADRVEIRAVPATDRDAMARELSRAGLVVLLSEHETQPIAILEALALGRPALVADTSGLSELARRGLARAVPLDSPPERVAAAALDQLRHPRALGPMDLPTWDACANALLDLYQSVLRNEPRRAH